MILLENVKFEKRSEKFIPSQRIEIGPQSLAGLFGASRSVESFQRLHSFQGTPLAQSFMKRADGFLGVEELDYTLRIRDSLGQLLSLEFEIAISAVHQHPVVILDTLLLETGSDMPWLVV